MAAGISDKNDIPKYIRRLEKINRNWIDVGIFGSGKSFIAQYASANEFGARIPVTKKMRRVLHAMGLHLRGTTTHITIPERSFMRSTLDDRSDMKRATRPMYWFLDLSIATETVFERIGLDIRDAIRRKVRSNIKPQNHPFTIDRKKSGRTLIDKGIMINAIEYKVGP